MAIVILGSLYFIVLGYEQYRLTKVHNLDVVNSMRLCANLSSNSDAVRDCAEAVKRQKIGF
ncbi:MAG: hypothetical protein A3B04_00095 [Candidatus Portnoybacteria bacterium RIFCSPLOWO2_02_FULL_39_11]|uniref:Uncharacterized protein n=1 Tax=Candidatus Portnoybacteria bacterium RIFCSPLOWO2_02_FULL_39_11 TaxID=1802001 RepID=A0A1G2FP09_9BACT|nr:MAG: hypothetical protein A3B04_00095 [Candidatus Portnoybacteria bacterium RIFCSPLOWO2_02_FULL_39_11]